MEIVVLTVYLDVDGRKSVIQPESRATVHGGIVPVSSVIGMSQGMYLPESQKWSEAQHRGRMCVQQGVLYQQLLLVVQKQHRLAELYAAYPVGDDRILVELEIHDILVASGLVDVLTVTADTQVEIPAVLNQSLVQR